MTGQGPPLPRRWWVAWSALFVWVAAIAVARAVQGDTVAPVLVGVVSIVVLAGASLLLVALDWRRARRRDRSQG